MSARWPALVGGALLFGASMWVACFLYTGRVGPSLVVALVATVLSFAGLASWASSPPDDGFWAAQNEEEFRERLRRVAERDAKRAR